MKIVIFDLDNTLCDTIGAIPKAMNICYKYLKNFYPTLNFEKFYAVELDAFTELAVKKSIPIYSMRALYWETIFEKLGLSLNPIIIKNTILLYQDVLSKNVELFPGVFEMLEKIKSLGLKMYILSNGDYASRVQACEFLNIVNFFDGIVSSDLTQVDKPDPKAFSYILDLANVKPNQAIFVGDEFKNDIEGAQNMGIFPIYTRWTSKNKDKTLENIKSCDTPEEVSLFIEEHIRN